MDDFLQLSFSQLHQFHFIRPQWLWSILLLVAVWLLRNQMNKQSHWRNVLPPHLAQVLLNSSESPKNSARRGKVLIGFWLIAAIAMAGPTWQKIEKPVFQVKRASVILLDMSLSMRSTDIKPNRLSRARFKAIDLAEAIGDGEVALVAYAGDAFTISPLTPDARNLTALIPSLTPEIMPEPGSYPLLGLERSAELLVQAGYLTGDIFWFTDGIDDFDLQQIRTFAANTAYRINIIALGTSTGAPIKLADGSLLKDGTGSIVIPKLATAPLITIADMTNGLFVTTTANDRDIKTLASLTVTPKEDQNGDSDDPDKKLTGDDWHEFGPYLVLLILPFFASKFRRGSVFSALLVFGLLANPNQVTADTLNPTESDVSGGLGQSNKIDSDATITLPPPRPWYDTLFKTADKHGQEAYNEENYLQATTDFKDPQWKGSAAYKAGDYETALSYFSQDESASGWYNRGNTLAQLQKIDEAIEAYDNTLKIQPNHQQAKENKALLEQMKQQQEQQEQQSDQQQDGEQQQSDQQQQSDDQQQSEGDSQSESDSESEQGQQKNSQQSEPSAEPQEDSQSEQQQAEQSESEQEQQEAQAAEAQEKQQGEESEQEAAMTPLTAEQIAEQEQQQKIEQLLRKVSDDPATLLRNKMILENRKRQQSNRAPKGAKKSW
ncbi:VWA domain-containing protein [Psychrosphaera sp. 1_MG-2023]|nr:VWA domain-containing protein [Psychrosphaera sp. 1_MG-2023]MDO6719498.1 VWA domain-containing protein [Psychrosphaera sp. 1_MG-2023]